MILKRFTKSLIYIVTPLFLAAWLAGCGSGGKAVKPDPVEPFTPPSVTLSNESIHSPVGDMSARLPGDWVKLDVSKLESSQIFSIACNPAYTVSIIFTELPVDNNARLGFDKSGIRGLALTSFQRRYTRSGYHAQMRGEIEEFAIGLRKFAAYTCTTDSMKTQTRVAVFYTNTHLYECAISQMSFRDNDLPSMPVVRYIHQLVLSSIEW